MNRIAHKINAISKGIAVLIDPDKFMKNHGNELFMNKLNSLNPEFIFIGGSTVSKKDFEACAQYIKQKSLIDLVIFPGKFDQISEAADAILLLSLLSSQSYEFIFGQHIKASESLDKIAIEILSTAYLLIDGESFSSVQKVTNSKPLRKDDFQLSKKIVLAAKQMGMKNIYLDAGSGAKTCVDVEMIKFLSSCRMPIIVGGGIKDIQTIDKMHQSGANLVVIGNHLEKNIDFFNDLLKYKENLVLNKGLKAQIETFD